MKTKIATVLSIVGVLGAGSAAALVNTQSLDGAADESAASAAVLPPAATVDLTVPPTTIDDSDDNNNNDDDDDDDGTTSTTVVTTSVPDAATIAPTTSAPSAAEFLTAFNVGASGVVTVDVVDGRLILVNAEAAAGWTVASTEEDRDDNDVEVEFTSATVRVEFEASFDGSVITPSVSSEAIPTNGPTTTTPHDDDHDDDRDDDHDDDDWDDD